jgi:hypothetical protein
VVAPFSAKFGINALPKDHAGKSSKHGAKPAMWHCPAFSRGDATLPPQFAGQCHIAWC